MRTFAIAGLVACLAMLGAVSTGAAQSGTSSVPTAQPLPCRPRLMRVGPNRPPRRGAINLARRTLSCITAVTSVSAAPKCGR